MSDYGNQTPPPPSDPPSYSTGGSSGDVPQSATSATGFFGALFDFSFAHFITPMIVKFVYILATVAIALGWLFFLVASFSQSAGAGVVVLILGPIVAIIYLAFIRMTLEFYLAIVRMSQDVHQRLPQS